MKHLIAALTLAWLSSAILTAHHGWAGYGGPEFEITGTVQSPLNLAGPHATMKVNVDGKVWNVVLAPPPRTTQAGLKEGIVPVGAKSQRTAIATGIQNPRNQNGTAYWNDRSSTLPRPRIGRISVVDGCLCWAA